MSPALCRGYMDTFLPCSKKASPQIFSVEDTIDSKNKIQKPKTQRTFFLQRLHGVLHKADIQIPIPHTKLVDEGFLVLLVLHDNAVIQLQ